MAHGPSREKVWNRRVAIATALAVLAALIVAAFALTGRRAGLDTTGPRRETAWILDAAAGATVEPLDAETAREFGVDPQEKGVIVTSLAANGPAARAGIRTGDIIERIGKMPVNSEHAAAAALKDARPPIVLLINRRGRYARVHLPIRSVADVRKSPEEGDER